MASTTTYGDYLRPMPGGFRNIGKPLTILGAGCMVLSLVIMYVNPLAGLAFTAVWILVIGILAHRNAQHRSRVDLAAEKHAYRQGVRKGYNLYRSGLLGWSQGGSLRLPGVLSHVRLMEAHDGYGTPFALVFHEHTGDYSLLLACKPAGASLVDPEVEDSYVAGWAQTMEALASKQGVTQMAVTVDTCPDSGLRFKKILSKHVVQDAPDLAARAMSQVMNLYASGGSRSDVILTLTFHYMSRNKPVDVRQAARRIALLLPQIRALVADAGGGTVRLMDMRQVSLFVRRCYDPAIQDDLEASEGEDGEPTVDFSDCGPASAEASWDWYRHDSGVSRTWEMCDVPNNNVTSSTLASLLRPVEDCDMKRVTLLFHMMPKGASNVFAERNRVTATGVKKQLRNPTMKSDRQVAAADQQGVETVQGAVIVFFGLLVTGTIYAGEREAERLDAMSAAIEQAAQGALVDLRPCYGAQDVAFAACLPLGLNLRQYKPKSVLTALTEA